MFSAKISVPPVVVGSQRKSMTFARRSHLALLRNMSQSKCHRGTVRGHSVAPFTADCGSPA